ncbi:uncharacterized protein LOC126475848 [Schistocerca serialis cubense]|uniref:uncharacterized protein LOC126475848 n=1 Tax=Schistocerca serialis cubense TaxID=2023355 RepID=UPI00214E5573|nr:uncharacterized protein LOC126475848 [Schistocerca serialis cubense]
MTFVISVWRVSAGVGSSPGRRACSVRSARRGAAAPLPGRGCRWRAFFVAARQSCRRYLAPAAAPQWSVPAVCASSPQPRPGATLLKVGGRQFRKQFPEAAVSTPACSAVLEGHWTCCALTKQRCSSGYHIFTVAEAEEDTNRKLLSYCNGLFYSQMFSALTARRMVA